MHYDVTMNRRSANGTAKRPASTRLPVTIRLPEDVVKRIDEDLEQREIPLSRNNWLLEAAIEKLRKNNSGGSRGTQ
jgi:hypothetical protein